VKFAALLILGGFFSISTLAQTNHTSPPDHPVKLIFIHHSTGENWLADDYGNLGRALTANNYFASDTNYGWGPNSIGDRTDIVNWREWFTGSESSRYTQALYNESQQNSYYTRTIADPGGENQIVMFKSCFPNSALEGSPNDSPDPDEDFTVGHAKYVYNDLLNYFITHPDKLFVIVTAPPLQDPTYANNARAFNNWLVYDWLAENNYTLNNVAVFDFYNVLTHPDNHHRVNNGEIEHVNNGINTLYYDSNGDNHPNVAGSQKATDEFIPLLNLYYHRWMERAPETLPPNTDEPNLSDESQTPLEEDSTSGEKSLSPDAPVLDSSSTDLIDDFEGQLPSGTEGWQPYWDEPTATAFSCFLENGSLRIDFNIVSESWATCSLFYEVLQDWSQFEGIAFRYKADAPARIFDVTVHGGTVEESTSYQYTIESIPGSEAEWIPIDLTWNQILGVDWEADARNPVDPSQITGVSFGFSTYEGTSNAGTLWIDDLQLTGVESTTDTAEPQFSEGDDQPAERRDQAETESETPSQESRGLCPASTALIGLSFVGIFILKRRNLR
jgi:hypothetical protein